MRRLAIIAAVLATAMPHAFASGSLDCTIKDKIVQLELHAGVTRGMGGPFFSFKAEMKSSLPNNPAVTFEIEHLAQRWLDEREAKLVIYRESESNMPHGYVEIRIETKRVSKKDEGRYAGTYVMEMYASAAEGKPERGPIQFRGRVTCSAE